MIAIGQPAGRDDGALAELGTEPLDEPVDLAR